MNGTSNEYALQGAYIANSHIGTITELQAVYLAICDTNIFPSTYTGPGHIELQVMKHLKNIVQIDGAIIVYPRNYSNAVFEMVNGTYNFALLQNSMHGGAPIAIVNPATKTCQFVGDCNIPHLNNSASTDTVIQNICGDVYIETEVDDLTTNINH